MREIEPLLGIREIMKIFRLSQVSVYRKVAAARSGKGEFPLPIWGSKQGLRWNAADVEVFCQSKTVPRRPVRTNGSKRQRWVTKELMARNESAQKSLADRHGIFVNSGKDE